MKHNVKTLAALAFSAALMATPSFAAVAPNSSGVKANRTNIYVLVEDPNSAPVDTANDTMHIVTNNTGTLPIQTWSSGATAGGLCPCGTYWVAANSDCEVSMHFTQADQLTNTVMLLSHNNSKNARIPNGFAWNSETAPHPGDKFTLATTSEGDDTGECVGTDNNDYYEYLATID